MLKKILIVLVLLIAGFAAVVALQPSEFHVERKVGERRMTIVESRQAGLVDIKVDFTGPFTGTNMSTFTFKPAGDGTAVTWSMSGHQNFLEKAVCLVMNGKKMIGDQLVQGLAQLKTAAEKKA